MKKKETIQAAMERLNNQAEILRRAICDELRPAAERLAEAMNKIISKANGK